MESWRNIIVIIDFPEKFSNVDYIHGRKSPVIRKISELVWDNYGDNAHLFLMTVTISETDSNPGLPDQEMSVIFVLIDHDDSEYRVSITITYLPERSNRSDFAGKPEIYFDTLTISLELRFDPESRRSGEFGFDK